MRHHELSLRERYLNIRPSPHQATDVTAAMREIWKRIWVMYMPKDIPILKLKDDNSELKKLFERRIFEDNSQTLSIAKMIGQCAEWDALSNEGKIIITGTLSAAHGHTGDPILALEDAMLGRHGLALQFQDREGQSITDKADRSKEIVIRKFVNMAKYGHELALLSTQPESTNSRLRNSVLGINRLFWSFIIASCSTTVALLTFASILSDPVEVLKTFNPLTEDSFYAFIEILKRAAYSEPIELVLASCGLISTFLLVGTGLIYLSNTSANFIEQHMNPEFAAYIKFEEAFCALHEPFKQLAKLRTVASSSALTT